MRIFLSSFVSACVLVGCSGGNATKDIPESVTLWIGNAKVIAEVSATKESLERGLMYREKLPLDRGMLFVFPEKGRHCMWMKNTVIPLDVAFIDDNWRIVNIERMEPLTLTEHCARKPVRIALEVSGGWFEQQGVGVGFSVAVQNGRL